MKFTIVATFLAACAAAKTIDELVQDIPTCAVNCIRDAAESVNCGVTDFACTCPKANSLTGTIVQCLLKSGCSQDDQKTVILTATQICEQFNAGASATGSITVGAITSGTADPSRTTTHASITTGAGTAGAASATTQAPGAAGRVQVAGWAGALAAFAVVAL